jgi:hypothetical protein
MSLFTLLLSPPSIRGSYCSRREVNEKLFQFPSDCRLSGAAILGIFGPFQHRKRSLNYSPRRGVQGNWELCSSSTLSTTGHTARTTQRVAGVGRNCKNIGAKMHPYFVGSFIIPLFALLVATVFELMIPELRKSIPDALVAWPIRD